MIGWADGIYTFTREGSDDHNSPIDETKERMDTTGIKVGKETVSVTNAIEEKIAVKDIYFTNDDVDLKVDVFESKIDEITTSVEYIDNSYKITWYAITNANGEVKVRLSETNLEYIPGGSKAGLFNFKDYAFDFQDFIGKPTYA